MVVHVFNSGLISGPETLVLPAMPLFREPQSVVFLVEGRLGERGRVPAEYAKTLGLRVETVEVGGRIDTSAVGRLRGALRGLEARVVHAHDVKATTYSWLASWGQPWRRISTHHGVAGRPDWKTKGYELFYSQVVLPRMHVAIAVSPEDERTLRGRAFGARRLVYVKNGVTRRMWAGPERMSERSRIRKAWCAEFGNITDDTPVMGVVARLSPEKGHLYLLRTLAEMKRERPDIDWRLVAVGSGALAEELKQAAAGLGLDRNVLWFGYRSDAPAMMPGFDALMFASSAEGLPIAALEAGWAGVPIFASEVGALPELVGTEHEAGGVMFRREQGCEQTAKRLAWLLDHPLERERMGIQLQNRVAKEYSARAWVERMEAIYQSV